MAFQFVHMAAYSRKGDGKGRSTRFVFNEARRDPGASVHVPNPAPPVVVFGVGVDEVERLHDAAADAATTTPKGGKPRRIQKTQHTLMTVVASHPHTMDVVRADPEKRREAEEWEKRTVAWLRSQYGNKLVSVIRHEDESHYHLHAYVLPDDRAMRANAQHPGQCAKAAVLAASPAEGEDSKTLFDGFRTSKVASRIRAAVESEMEALRHAVADAADRASAADAGRRKSEARARSLRENLTETGRELAAARRELAALRPPELEHTPSTSTPVLRKR